MDNLFETFEQTNKHQWLAKVGKDLKGKPIEGLNWQVNDHITLSPFAHREDRAVETAALDGQKANNDWEIGETILVQDAVQANRQALAALEQGVAALRFVFRTPMEQQEIAQLLAGIEQEWISTHFVTAPTYVTPLMEQFLNVLEQKGANKENIKGSLQMAGITKSKALPLPTEALFATLPKFKFITVDGTDFYQNDTTMTDELALILAKGNAYLQQLDPTNFATIQFAIAVGKSYFVNISKIRALKLLWRFMLKSYDATLDLPIPIEGHLALAAMEANKYSNMISSTTQAMSAIIAGVDRLYILPSDVQEEEAGTPFSLRIARNVQHLLKLESHLDHVVDPSAGSYYVEEFTDRIAEETWKKFQAIERNGGFANHSFS